jgi:AraC family transcriptional regulator of adaptative response / DNA-3-methyladenine glycosylase II
VRFYPTAAAAQSAGFRACKRCRPDAVPGSPEWNNRADVVARAMRLIADGEVDRSGVEGLASRLGYSSRHLNRLLLDEVGAGPLALARAQRATAARTLVQTSDLPFAEVAFAAGFASIRQFNDTVRAVFAATPTELRRAARKGRGAEAPAAGSVELRLSHRSPLDAAHLFAFLARRAVPGIEAADEGGYQRTLRLPHGPAVVDLRPGVGHVMCRLHLTDWRDLTSAVARCRRLLDLDADPEAVDAFLADDPILGESVQKWPGRRVPGHVDGAEVVTRAVLGQQVSVTAARRLAGWLVAEHGETVPEPVGSLARLFPTPDVIAGIDPESFPMPRSRSRAVVAAAAAVAAGDVLLDAGADREGARAALLATPGIGPWTADYVAMRALGDADAFLPADTGVRAGLKAAGVPSDRRSAETISRSWRPWRAYAMQHLWTLAAPAATGASAQLGPHTLTTPEGALP